MVCLTPGPLSGDIMPTLPKIELPFRLPTFDLPAFDLPRFDMPAFDLPEVDLPSADQVLGVLRDAAYAGTGLVALTAERIGELQATLFDIVKTQVEAVVAPVA